MRILQRVNIASAPVLYPAELLEDPHFIARKFFEESNHPVVGKKLVPGMIAKMSISDCRIRFSAPLFGQHNDYVFNKLLELTKDEIAELIKNGIIGNEPQFLGNNLPVQR